MSEHLNRELIVYLADVQAMERQALQLLDNCIGNPGDESIARIYRTHRRQTELHARDIAGRLEAHGKGGSLPSDIAAWLRGPEIERSAGSVADTPAKLAVMAYAFENLEIAAYHLLRGVARRAG